jgi:hypothetical protein
VSADFEYAVAAGIETQLWAAHLKINAGYKKQLRHVRVSLTSSRGTLLTSLITQVKRNAKDQVVEMRKLARHYMSFIKESQKFYRRYIMSLDAQIDGIPELRKAAQKWKDDSA